jgi:hypothetical protein
VARLASRAKREVAPEVDQAVVFPEEVAEEDLGVAVGVDLVRDQVVFLGVVEIEEALEEILVGPTPLVLRGTGVKEAVVEAIPGIEVLVVVPEILGEAQGVVFLEVEIGEETVAVVVAVAEEVGKSVSFGR